MTEAEYPSATSRLARLFVVHNLAEGSWRPEELSAVWSHQLRAPLEPAPSAPGVATGSSNPSRDCPPGTASTLAELLAQPNPLRESLVAVKNLAKTRISQSQESLPQEIATGMYYAAIAAALIRLGDKITALAPAELAAGLNWCLNRSWLDESTRTLFQQALARIRSSQAKREEAAGM